MKTILTYLFIVGLTFSAYAKKVEVDSFLIKKEAEIKLQLDKLRGTKEDAMIDLENESLVNLMREVLVHPGVMEYPFDELSTMSTIKSPDDAFRLFNWNVEKSSGLHFHYCFMVIPKWGDRPNEVIEFNEDKITIPPRPTNTLTPRQWYGALYYNIISVEKGSKTYYTVIGYNGSGRSTNKKILDVFYFKGKKLKLGYPLFQEAEGSKRLVRRVFFEYSEKVTIGVNMNDRLEAIVFDHLIPETPNLEGMYDFYVPDMTYDAYRWEGTIWKYEEDLIAVNNTNKKRRIYNPNAGEDGEPEYIEVKDEWEDPVDGNPNGGGTNAVAPLEETDNKGKKNKKTKAKKDRKFKLFQRKKNKPRSAITG
ncbi:MAG: hypothetical protein ACPG21_12980 [Crocinitomicaceae bacterium]